MQKTNYQKMNDILLAVDRARESFVSAHPDREYHLPSLLLHSCCAPCSSAVIERLRQRFDITVYYYNPNILPATEYYKRRDEQQKFLSSIGVPFVEAEYVPSEYFDAIAGYEHLGERTERCRLCYALRMSKAHAYAVERHFDYFATTLTLSPHKIEQWINEIGERLASTGPVKYLYSDFKKDNGYLRSTELSKIYGFYRQNYCGCGLRSRE